MSRIPSYRSLLLTVPFAAAVGVLVSAAPAWGHPGHSTSGLGAGLLHPLTGPDHLLAMVAVGVVAATWNRAGSAWLAPGAFLSGMVLGGVAGIVGIPFPGAETLIIASVILLGLTIAGAVEVKDQHLAVILAPLALAGMAHGYAHGAEVPSSVHPAAYVAGFLLATAALHAVGVGVGTVIRDRRTIRFGLGLATVAAGALLFV
jgi:urease accessory protein